MSAPEPCKEALRWQRFAREDLAAARALLDLSEMAPRQACWLSQQASEKALKSIFVMQQIDFPRLHDLDVLHGLLPSGWTITVTTEELAWLSEWSIEGRYPGDWPEAAQADATRAVELATTIVDLVARLMRKHRAAD